MQHKMTLHRIREVMQAHRMYENYLKLLLQPPHKSNSFFKKEVFCIWYL